MTRTIASAVLQMALHLACGNGHSRVSKGRRGISSSSGGGALGLSAAGNGSTSELDTKAGICRNPAAISAKGGCSADRTGADAATAPPAEGSQASTGDAGQEGPIQISPPKIVAAEGGSARLESALHEGAARAAADLTGETVVVPLTVH